MRQLRAVLLIVGGAALLAQAWPLAGAIFGALALMRAWRHFKRIGGRD